MEIKIPREGSTLRSISVYKKPARSGINGSLTIFNIAMEIDHILPLTLSCFLKRKP